MSTQIEAIFLDVGGVVLEIDWMITMRQLGFNSPRAQGEALKRIFDWEPFNQYERGEVSSHEFFRQINELFNTRFSEKDQKQAWNALVIDELPGVNDIFDQFGKKVPIYALSNTNEEHYSYIKDRYPVLKRFEKFFASNEVGARKPEPEVFRRVLAATGHSAQTSIFIDDSQMNVEAADRLGFSSYQTVNSIEQSLARIRSHFR